MTQNTANHHVIVTGVAAALVMSTALAGCTAPRAAAASADAAEPIPVTVAQVAMTEVAGVIDVGWRGAGPHHGHDHLPRPGAGA